MADVLIVCVREDEHQAKAFADMFERAGLNVGGAPSADADLRRSGAAVVIWSQASIRSRAFLDAAQRAVNAGKAVIACMIDPPPPASINNSPCFDLRDWSGDAEDPALDPLFFAVDRMVTQARGAGAPAAAPDHGLAAAAAAATPRAQATVAAAPPPYARTARNAPQPAPAPAPSFDPSPRQPAPMRAAPVAPAADVVTAEAQNWKQIRHSRNPEDFLQHLARFGPDGAFSEVAQLRLNELEAQSQPAQAPQRPRRPAAPPVAQPPAAAMPA
ncbi:MAG: hypothetical protein NW203_05210, partial [Hyphomonadaceae bacterium]|nr:hypothetical protein [Hyphomonadaceae bacterium]